MTKEKTKIVELLDPKYAVNKKKCAITGSKFEPFPNVLIRQALNTLWVAHDTQETADDKIKMVLVGMMGVNPQDEVEGMLAAQMVAAHNASMECFRRAMLKEQTFEGRKENLSQANKLTRSYAAMMEALGRYRGKGQQKMTVEHVHVHAGGQAIVGNVTRPEGGGTQTKTEEQPHAKQVTHAPMQEVPSSNTQEELMPVTSNA